jgi:hypothetical protein
MMRMKKMMIKYPMRIKCKFQISLFFLSLKYLSFSKIQHSDSDDDDDEASIHSNTENDDESNRTVC